MNNFVYHIPTKVYFGKGQIENLACAAREYGTRVLVVSYLGCSPAEQHIYHDVIENLKQGGLAVWELRDVQANPRVSSINEGARLCRTHEIELVLGVGGGSAIDCAKGIAEAASYSGDAWDLVLDNSKVGKVLPVACVATIAASGSEMDTSAVISNPDTNEKLMLFNDNARPKFSILDPTYTFSVPPFQTAVGSIDIVSHVMEVYFSQMKDTYLQDRIAEAIMKTCMHYARTAIEEPDNYEARANLLWAASLAINGLISCGKGGDWAVHNIEHEISAYFPTVTHGAGIAVITPHWMEYTLDESTVERYQQFAENVCAVPTGLEPFEAAKQGIAAFKAFYASLNLPTTLRELGVTEEYFPDMARGAVRNGPICGFRTLEYDDVLQILKNAY